MLLAAHSIHKSYSGVHALRGVSFELAAGEVHALVGENGAGKSTFIKIITGAETADSGSIALGGHRLSSLTPASARALGITAIYQHPALFPDLTVAENIALALEPARALGRVDWRVRRAEAKRLLAAIGADFDVEANAGTLTM